MRITSLINRKLPAAAWGFLAASFLVAGCAGLASSPNSTPTPPVTPPAVVSITVAPATSSVQTGQTQQFTATVTNDSQNKGVTWALSGTGCSAAACGALSASSSASGTAITYTAPAAAPAPASVTLTASSVADATKSASAAITITAPPAAITVTVSPQTASLAVGATQTFAATVTNDTQNKGVTWTLSGAGCSGAACGSVSPASSASGAAVTYTAPATAPTSAVTLTATSVADATKSAAATITITKSAAAIAVTVSPQTAGVVVGGTQAFAATVTNDSQNKGVTWTLSGTGCSGSACGSVSPASSASGAAVTYTAPATAPSSAITLTATSVADATKSASATITVTSSQLITVTISPTSANVPAGGTQSFIATVTNDSQNKGVTWTLSGAACAEGSCGSISPTTSASGIAITYTAPATVPSPATIDLTAASAADPVITATALITVTAAATSSTPLLLGTAAVSEGFGLPVIATDAAGNIDVAWVENGAEFVRSTDGGATFSAPLRIPSNLPASSNSIQMALDSSGNINLLWRADVNIGDTVASNFFSRSTDGGHTFSTPVNVSTTPVKAQLSVQPSGTIVVAWFDRTTSNLLVATSTDGVNFSTPVTVWTAVGNPTDLSTAVGPQGQIYLFWTQMRTNEDCSILFSHSPDAATFSPAADISANSGSCNEHSAAFVDPAGNLDVAWNGDGDSLFFIRSTDSGSTFSFPVSVPGSAGPTSQQIAVGPDGSIDVVWVSGTALLFSRSLDGGGTFSATPTALGLISDSTPPEFGVDACNHISVVGQGKTSDIPIAFEQSKDGGVTFGSPKIICNLLNNYEQQLVLDNNGNVNVVWGVDGPADILYVRIPTTCTNP
jgi:hypothetical protein